MTSRDRGARGAQGKDADPRCAFGTPWIPHRRCKGCAAEAKRLQLAFRIAVFEGKLDADGYTPAERRAQQKRKRAA